MYKIKILILAQQDVQEIIDYYDSINPEITDRFLRKLFLDISTIKRNPKIFAKKYKEIRMCYLQKFPFNIYFKINDNNVEIIAVLHTSRNPDIWKKR